MVTDGAFDTAVSEEKSDKIEYQHLEGEQGSEFKFEDGKVEFGAGPQTFTFDAVSQDYKVEGLNLGEGDDLIFNVAFDSAVYDSESGDTIITVGVHTVTIEGFDFTPFL